MSLNWGARAPTSCHYLVYLPCPFTTHMTAVCSSSLSSYSHQAFPQRPVTTHILLRTVGRWGEEEMLPAVKEQEPNRPDRQAPPGS